MNVITHHETFATIVLLPGIKPITSFLLPYHARYMIISWNPRSVLRIIRFRFFCRLFSAT